MPASPKATTSGPQSPTATATPTPIAAPTAPTPIAPPATTASTTASSSSAAFTPLPQHATNPHFQDLMARIRRAEKFGGAVSDADRTMYRQFKFGTFTAPAAKKGGGAGGAGGVPKTTASPAGKSGAAASKKSGAGKAGAAAAGLEAAVAAAGKKKGGLLDGISDEDRLARLKRAYKFGVDSTPEIKALDAWYLGKFGEPFSLGKQ